ncbi:protein kinase [Streptomyces sp. NBC_00249]|uniref:WD40 repeat domain-containing serine/threonine protein kinase n=1 Tax=Streptomyces sp. NBC_00249 TaxID=2975690 RepID=UPI002252E931|nr:serine/threonine-protein kinase [Streptomyces sp. NBC_00249]MCX5192369.1 protein kinase [Streptomyces sp. NBC_00249]
MDALLPHDPRWVGPYRLDGRLGEGGMGQVFLGTSPGGRRVAVKLIRAELAGTAQFRERFAREVEAARQVGGFHTAQVVDADPSAESPWLVTAFIPGPTLHRAVAEHGPVDPAGALRLGAGLAEGLAAIHRCGLVHRDLKPGNVILAEDGPRVIDFGIARAVDASSLTATGSVIGTYAYMSPEQIRADRAGPASDVFALGSVLAFAATGRGPFDAPSLLAVVQRILDEPPALDGIDGELRAILTECLAKDPAHRPAVEGLPARFAAAVAGAARIHPPRREPTVVAAPSGQTRQAPRSAQSPQPPPTDRARAAGPGPAAGAGQDPRALAAAVTRTYAPPAGPAAPGFGAAVPGPGSPVPGRPTTPVPGPARRGPSRRALLIGGASVAAVAAIGVPAYLLLRKSDALEGPSSAYELAFSPDGKTIAAVGGGGEIWRWSLPGKESSTTRIGIAQYIQPHVFSRDLKTLYRAEEHKILKWDVATGRTVGTFTGETTGELQDGFVHGLGLSPDGKTLAASSGRGLYLWDTGSASRLALLQDVKNGPALYSPDGAMLLAGSPVQLRKGSADAVLATLDATVATGAVFSPDGQLLAFGDQGDGVRLWNTATRQDVATLEGHDSPVQAVAFHPDGTTLASGDRDGKVIVWSTVSGTSTATYEPGASVEALAFSPDGKSLAAGCSGGTSVGSNDTVWLWQVG